MPNEALKVCVCVFEKCYLISRRITFRSLCVDLQRIQEDSFFLLDRNRPAVLINCYFPYIDYRFIGVNRSFVCTYCSSLDHVHGVQANDDSGTVDPFLPAAIRLSDSGQRQSERLWCDP